MRRSRRRSSIYIVAGEESGDALGAALARALRGASRRRAEACRRRRAGDGGGRDCQPVPDRRSFDHRPHRHPAPAAEDFAHHPRDRRLPSSPRAPTPSSSSTVRTSPTAWPAGCGGCAPSIPILDYVSPSVWAWRPGRARAMRAYVDHVLAILPFEPAAHLRLGGPPCLYVGHPLIERVAELRPNARGGGASAGRPAGRPGAAGKPPQRDPASARRFSARQSHRSPSTSDRSSWCCRPFRILSSGASRRRRLGRRRREIVVEPAEKLAAFRRARAALAASGTVTLELALAGVPSVAAYQVPLAEEAILQMVRFNARLSSVILANLVIGENVVPEFLQRDCTPRSSRAGPAAAARPTPRSGGGRSRRSRRLDTIMAIGDAAPSAKAAAVVLDVAQRGRRDAPPSMRRRGCERGATSAVISAGIRAAASRCRAGADGRASDAGPRSFPSTARSSRRCAPARTAP